MAKFLVETDGGKYVVETEDSSPVPPLPAQGPSLPAANAATVAQPAQQPSLMQQAGTALSAPIRGFRGLGVGAQRLIEGDSPYKALGRAAEAVKPGYLPLPGERIGAGIGSAVPLAPLGIVPGIAASAAHSGAETLAEGKSVAEAGIETAKTGAIGAAGAGVIKGSGGLLGLAGKIGKAAFRSTVAKVKGVGRRIVDSVFDATKDSPTSVAKAGEKFVSAVNKSKSIAGQKMSQAKSMTVSGATPDEVSAKAIDFVKEVRAKSSALTKEAAEKLTDEAKITGDELLIPVNNALEGLKVKGAETGSVIPGIASQKAAGALKRWASAIKQLTEKPTEKLVMGPDKLLTKQASSTPVKISEKNLKKLIDQIDDDTVWDGPADEPIKKTLREVRGYFGSLLKRNKEYAKALEPVSKMIKTAEDIEDAFALERGANKAISATDQTVNRAKAMIGGKRQASEEAVKSSELGPLFMNAKQRALREGAKKTALNEAEKGIKETAKLADPAKVKSLSETAARQGVGSSAHDRLVRELVPMLGEEQGRKTALDLISAASQEIFARSQGSGLPGGAKLAALGEAPLKGLKATDKLFGSTIKAGKKIGKAGRYAPSVLFGVSQSNR